MEKITFTSIISKFEKTGIFFRSPIQRVFKDTYDGEAFTWRETAIKKIIPFILNMKLYKHSKTFLEESNCAGLYVNELCSPIYFNRTTRKAFYMFSNHPEIDYIKSEGYEPYKNDCSGSCEKETTIIKFKSGIKQKIIHTKSFHYTYKHIIEEEFVKN